MLDSEASLQVLQAMVFGTSFSINVLDLKDALTTFGLESARRHPQPTLLALAQTMPDTQQ